MLVLTEAAAEAVKSLSTTSSAAPESGLRIESSAAEPGGPEELQATAATGPSENDEVIEAAGAHVYLDQKAAAYLADKVLDAQVDQEGKARFSLGMQDPGPL